MIRALALVLLCTPALLAAQKSCDKSRAQRTELVRTFNAATLPAWQSVTLDQQIL